MQYKTMVNRLKPLQAEVEHEHELEVRFCEGGVCEFLCICWIFRAVKELLRLPKANKKEPYFITGFQQILWLANGSEFLEFGDTHA